MKYAIILSKGGIVMDKNNLYAVGQFKDKVYDVKTGELIKETEWSKIP